MSKKHNQAEIHKQSGISIVELVIVMSVFAILLPAVAGMISSIASIGDRSRDMFIVHSLAENKMESLRSISFTGLTNGTTSFASELPATLASPRSATYTISSVNSALKQIDINITYTDRGASRNIEYRSYIGELGVGQY